MRAWTEREETTILRAMRGTHKSFGTMARELKRKYFRRRSAESIRHKLRRFVGGER